MVQSKHKSFNITFNRTVAEPHLFCAWLVLPSSASLLMQEYLRLSDVYRMYGNAAVPACSASPAALHCLSFTVTPALSCEVQTLLVLSHCTLHFPRQLSYVLLSVNVCVCCFWCKGVHHSQSVKPYFWDAKSCPLLFLFYSIIPTHLLWNQLFVPLGHLWPFLPPLCTGWLCLPYHVLRAH